MTTTTVTSADGTKIAYDRAGTGPALVLIDGACCYRHFGPQVPLAAVLATDFTVYTYDRRGRGESTDTLPYSVQREVEDIEAVIQEAGGSAFLYGHSSGALLAAQSHRLSVPKMVLFEPPVGDGGFASFPPEFVTQLGALVDEGKRGDAVEMFNRAIGVPDEVMDGMMRPVWPALEALAHTLLYDCAIVAATDFDVVRSVQAETLVLSSHTTGADMAARSAAVAENLPNGTHRALAGEWHGVAPEDLAKVLIEFYQG
ncbi:alpha/beta fold hydrolase [Actinocrispum wychmicini]|uniref:Alpha/beta hydrolase family protein n=1 Tax=Actinocrispum wychmicini TaxID=1213861 RepID=A0A4R2JFJ7_9PSEU|nr:alpha/beta hydrolase [Actinocrispum wychmicini]TCO57002.1 alpha/beta hydrolase family protein [Actinocrispum wychmicini]